MEIRLWANVSQAVCWKSLLKGKIVKEVCILPEGVKEKGFAFMRNARRLDNGHFLVAHYGPQCVTEYDMNGKSGVEPGCSWRSAFFDPPA